MVSLQNLTREKSWDANASNTYEEIGTSCLLRIADATEKMARNYTALQNDLDWYKQRFREEVEACKRLQLSNAALRGQITKLKKRNASHI